MSFLVANAQKNITNSVKSTRSYYSAEAGIEDALLRLKRNPSMPALTYYLNVDGVSVNVNIPSTIGVSKNITSEADNKGIMKKIRTVCSIDNTTTTSFYYGVQVGEGGLVMNNGSRVKGNVFSSGNISGSGIIDNNAIVSGNGKSISGVTVQGNAMAYSCLSGATIDGSLTYVTGGVHTCTHGVLAEQSEEILAQPPPIPDSQVDGWKSEATTACASADVTKLTQNNKTVSMGPCKITGNITFGNGLNLTLTGTLYITGNLTLGNTNSIKLNSSYGTLGGVVISDGNIQMGRGNIFAGSGQAGSYVLVVSTSTSDSAIVVGNNSVGAVFYTTAGGITISNNVSVVEATGYKVIMENNSTIEYSSGIVNIYFASGPGGGWKVSSWQDF